jgi:hypothetical protein
MGCIDALFNNPKEVILRATEEAKALIWAKWMVRHERSAGPEAIVKAVTYL